MTAPQMPVALCSAAPSEAAPSSADVVALPVAQDETDAHLVTRHRSGDEHALEVLYRRHAPALLAFSTRLVGQRSEADDAVHDAFLTIMRQLGGLRDGQAFRSWARQIVLNECRMRLRRRSRFRLFSRHERPDEFFDSIAGRAEQQEHAAELRRIGTLIRRLRVDDRIAWSLRYIEGCTLEEGAELAGCSLATFKRRLSRASRHVARWSDGHLVMEAP